MKERAKEGRKHLRLQFSLRKFWQGQRGVLETKLSLSLQNAPALVSLLHLMVGGEQPVGGMTSTSFCVDFRGCRWGSQSITLPAVRDLRGKYS